MNAECREIRPLLSAYMDNELSPDEVRAVRAHSATCAECAAILAEYRQVRSAMRSLSQPTPPPALRAAVFAKATPAYRRRANVVALGQRGISYASLAAAMIAIFFTAALLLRSGIGTPAAVAQDTTPPRIVSTDPPGGTTEWGLDRPLRVYFSEPMDHKSVEAALVILTEPALSDAEHRDLLASLSWEDNTLVIGQGIVFRPDTDYIIRIDPSMAQDTAGNRLQEATVSYRVRTIDVIAAAPTATVPVIAAAPTAAPTVTARAVETETPPPAAPTAPASAQAPRATATAPNFGAITPMPTQYVPPVAAPPTNTPVQVPPTATAPPPTIAPSPTPTVAAPTATPQPTATATAAPASPTVAPTVAPSPTATAPKSPYAAGQTFAPLYNGNATVAEALGLPTGNEGAVQGSYLAFEHGWMIRRADTNTIYVLFNESPTVWYAFADGWSEGMDVGGGPAAKAGLFKPQRGLGKVWADNPEVQRRLGFALSAEESRGTLAVQNFERGMLIGSDLGAPFVYVFYQNNIYERYGR